MKRIHPRTSNGWRARHQAVWRRTLLAGPLVLAVALATAGVAAAEGQAPSQGQVTSNVYSASAGSGPAPSTTGPAYDPLGYDCTTPASGPSGCQHVGITHGYFGDRVVNFLYSANFFCDRSVPSKATTGCEGGATYKHLPPQATSQDPLYIPVPLGFTPKQGLQCPMQGNCIDHPASMDLSALYPVLKPLLHLTSASQLDNAPLSPHSHVVYTRNDNLPEWWNVVIVPVTSQAGFDSVIATTSKAQLMADLGKGGVYTSTVPTNAFLYFQVLAGTGTVPADAAMGQGTYHGPTGPAGAGASAGLDPLAVPSNPGQTSDCMATAASPRPPACSDMAVGLTKGFYGGQTVNLLYTENYFCDRSVASKAKDGCEAGAPYKKLPPGTPSAADTSPLYIVTPLYKPEPADLQCMTPGYCIDHPRQVDLSRLAPVLDPILGTTPAELGAAPLSPHSHIVLTTNNYQPEWWNVHVIGVTSPAAYDAILSSSNKLATAAALAKSGGGATAPIPTNIFLWFQVLPGA